MAYPEPTDARTCSFYRYGEGYRTTPLLNQPRFGHSWCRACQANSFLTAPDVFQRLQWLQKLLLSAFRLETGVLEIGNNLAVAPVGRTRGMSTCV
jgi:hypothetical protein